MSELSFITVFSHEHIHISNHVFKKVKLFYITTFLILYYILSAAVVESD